MAAKAPATDAAATGPELKVSGRKIKELFYTEVEMPAAADGEEQQPHFRCRCGKVRAQSLKHGYTNLKQHVVQKHPEWLAECTDEVVAKSPGPTTTTPPKKRGRPRKSDAAITPKKEEVVAVIETVIESASIARKKRKMGAVAAAEAGLQAEEDEDKEKEKEKPRTGSEFPSPSSSSASMTSSSAAAATTESNSNTVGYAVFPASSSSVGNSAKKRTDYISWDDYFMSVAFLSAMRSKDPSTQVGACIVNDEKKIVGIGYNGFPNGCSDDTLPWARESKTENPLETKYPFVCHAEMNAILNKNSSDLKGCTIYIALFPCNECAKLIIQSGIKHIVYLSDKYHDDWKMVASRRMLDMAGVEYRQHHVDKSKIVIDFSSIE